MVSRLLGQKLGEAWGSRSYKRIPHDTVKDFAPVTQVGNSPLVLVVHPTLPVKRTKELIALAATPRDIVMKLHADFVKVLQTPEIRTTLARQGGEPVDSTLDQFQQMIVREIEQWAKVVKAAGIKAD